MHSSTHLLTRSSIRSLTYPFTHSLNNSVICFQVALCACPHLVRQLVNLWPLPAFVHLNDVVTVVFMHLFIHLTDVCPS